MSQAAALAERLAPAVRGYLERHPHLVPAPFRLALLAAGEYNLNFLASSESGEARLVVRLSTGSQEVAAGARQVEYEANALRLLAPSGIAPRLLHVDATPAGLPYGLLIEEFLPGRPLDYAQPDDLRLAASTLARLHAFRPPDATSVLLTLERPLSDGLAFGRQMLAPYDGDPRADPAVRRLMRGVEGALTRAAALEAQLFPAAERGVVHTDVQAHNFVVQKATGARMVDWEKPMVDDPTYDLCHFLAPTTTRWKCGVTLDAHTAEAFLDLYAAARERAGRPPTGGREALAVRRRLRQPFVHWRATTWCAMAWVEYQRPDRPIRHADTWERIVEFLAPDFLEGLFAPVLSGRPWWD